MKLNLLQEMLSSKGYWNGLDKPLLRQGYPSKTYKLGVTGKNVEVF